MVARLHRPPPKPQEMARGPPKHRSRHDGSPKAGQRSSNALEAGPDRGGVPRQRWARSCGGCPHGARHVSACNHGGLSAAHRAIQRGTIRAAIRATNRRSCPTIPLSLEALGGFLKVPFKGAGMLETYC
uniref:(northern house mosquito) hypothetical protein n=1 Tax=Culex pipiens TaxID=7175 RepID=A0A8D8I424_CULPI